MFTNLRLYSFKAFEKLDISLAPITLLLGPNNSGKSSILASLRLLVQTIESIDTDVALLFNGIMGDFGTYKDVVYSNDRRRNIHLGFTHTDIREIGRSWNFEKQTKFDVDVWFGYRSKRREVILKKAEIKINRDNLISTEYSRDTEKQTISKIFFETINPSSKASLARYLRVVNFLPRSLHIPPNKLSKKMQSIFGDEFEFSTLVSRVISGISRHLLNVEYIGAMRIPPERTYLFTGERRKRIGPNGQRAGNILVMDTAKGGKRKKRIINKVNDWLKKAQIASQLKIIPISERHYELRVQHPVTEELQNLADVGYGSSQVIPVLVGGYNLSSGSTYLIEEPEIHLHPRAQSVLGDFFLDMYKGGVQSIIETHSEHLVLRLQQYVARGIIPPEHIKIYYVYASEWEKKAVSLEMDSLGRFVSEWPEGFFPERLEEAKELSKIRYQAESKRGNESSN